MVVDCARVTARARPPKYLVSIGGDAWVDPAEVVAVDAAFSDDDPPWANVRVALRTGLILFGLRVPERVARAVRHPELEVESEEADEAYPEPGALAASRARLRRGRRASGAAGPRPLSPPS